MQRACSVCGAMYETCYVCEKTKSWRVHTDTLDHYYILTVLMDYKTDRGISAEALADRYRLQMEYYRKALRMMEDKEVGEMILWSFALGKAISL